MSESYYERLDVSPDASVAEVERAYRDRLKETHPDVSDEPTAADRTRELIEAKRVLTDADERAAYDRLGHAAYTGAGRVSSEEPRPDSDSATAATEAAATTGETDRERRRRQNRETRAAWNTRGGVAAGGAYARQRPAWDTDRAYRIHPTDASAIGRRLFPLGSSMVMLLVAFGVHPVLLWGSLEPAFPLPFNLVIGTCFLVLVGYLASIPPVGSIVFGTWAVLLPALLAWVGVQLSSPLWFAAVVGTVVPLVLSLAIWAVLRA